MLCCQLCPTAVTTSVNIMDIMTLMTVPLSQTPVRHCSLHATLHSDTLMYIYITLWALPPPTPTKIGDKLCYRQYRNQLSN